MDERTVAERRDAGGGAHHVDPAAAPSGPDTADPQDAAVAEVADLRVIEATDLDESHVLIEAILEVRGMASGVSVDAKLWQLAEIRDGLLHLVETYSDEGTARRVASLEGS